MKVLVTGSNGFIGRNLLTVMEYECPHIEPLRYDVDAREDALDEYARVCDFVVHLAGVNRPKDEAEFEVGNAGFTGTLIDALERAQNDAPILMTSSIHAAADTPYGRSKRAAEERLYAHAKLTGAQVHIARLPNVFGKGARPNYNSAVATFCHNIARGLPIQVNYPNTPLTLVYIDDVVDLIMRAIDGSYEPEALPTHTATLHRIVSLLTAFKQSRETLMTPDMGDAFTRKLYATYLSYVPEGDCAYPLATHADARGSFTEFIRTGSSGQMSVNVSKPGVVKGNHFHHTKHEKFLVVSGRGVIRLRRVGENRVTEYAVSSDVLTVVDILPGYTHNIENTGDVDMVTLMWASECFDPLDPDTYALEV